MPVFQRGVRLRGSWPLHLRRRSHGKRPRRSGDGHARQLRVSQLGHDPRRRSARHPPLLAGASRKRPCAHQDGCLASARPRAMPTLPERAASGARHHHHVLHRGKRAPSRIRSRSSRHRQLVRRTAVRSARGRGGHRGPLRQPNLVRAHRPPGASAGFRGESASRPRSRCFCKRTRRARCS